MLALLPTMLAEGAAVHLLLPDGWFWPKVALAALHLYGMVMFVSWAARSAPSRTGCVAVSSNCAASSSTARGSRPQTSRVSVLRFAATVRIERPLGDPVDVTEPAVAVDDPARPIAAVEVAHDEEVTAAPRRSGSSAWFVPADVAEAFAWEAPAPGSRPHPAAQARR